MAQHQGQCFCGDVAFNVEGEPASAGFCHCASCRQWSAAPINAFTLWPQTSVKITKGADKVGVYNKTPRSFRKYCKTCGGHLMTDHPQWNLVDVYAATIPAFAHKAGVHVHYQESVLPMHDGVPKMKDLPAEMGGSGQTIAD